MTGPPRELLPLRLGADTVRWLLPQRRPFLLVDTIEAFAAAPQPALRATRAIGAGEWVLQGHFPGFQVWPGTLTIEGMAQACNALLVIVGGCPWSHHHYPAPPACLTYPRSRASTTVLGFPRLRRRHK
jgi:3-hydroxymyristoyl/3-hydroxydecanoyl-(acyl carrier protein) dehydratase